MTDASLEYSQETFDVWPVRRLGGLPITIASRDQVANSFIKHALNARGKDQRPFYSTSANGQVLAMCEDDQNVRQSFLRADEILADGMPMVMYSKLFGDKKLPERVATTDLFEDVAKLATKEGVTFYMLGADEEANRLATEKMEQKYPGLNIVGRRNGYFSEDEEAAVCREINDLNADILWVSMGVPREQEFIWRNIDRLRNVGVIKTSGGLFDFLSGKRSRAPYILQMLGFEWAYRATLEPRRLGPRYITTNPRALKLLFTHSQ